MIVKVNLFAAAKDLMGQDQLAVELDDQASVRDLKLALATQFPTVSELISKSAIAIDHEYALDSTPIAGKTEIAIIPPVSGG